MIITAMIALLVGVLSVLRSGALSGRALTAEQFFNEGGLKLLLKHIFTHNPFDGYQKDIRILVYGLIGLLLMLTGLGLLVYFFAVSAAPAR